VTAEAAPQPQSLVPQNPVGESADGMDGGGAAAAPAAEPAPVAPKRTVKRRKPAAKQAQKGPGAGSFQMLFQGPGKN
jgi:hypothetical protein